MPTTETTIADLIREHRIMIFAKGTRDFPQCGFSARVVQIFETLGAEFEGFNVLHDLPACRQTLSAIVEEQTGGPWMTTPQVFLDGRFIGGCDIVADMFDGGELEQLIHADRPGVK
jgi:monothiol glutaredoxin